MFRSLLWKKNEVCKIGEIKSVLVEFLKKNVFMIYMKNKEVVWKSFFKWVSFNLFCKEIREEGWLILFCCWSCSIDFVVEVKVLGVGWNVVVRNNKFLFIIIYMIVKFFEIYVLCFFLF